MLYIVEQIEDSIFEVSTLFLISFTLKMKYSVAMDIFE
jgi:hypothetical protein